MNYDQYAEESANPPPGLCSVCGKLKDDGDVDERGKWVCFDCANINANVEKEN